MRISGRGVGRVWVRGEGLDLVPTSLHAERNLREPPGTDRTRKRCSSYTWKSPAYIRWISEKVSDAISTALRFTFRPRETRRGAEREQPLGGLLRDLYVDPSPQSPPPTTITTVGRSHRNRRARPNQFNVKLSPAGNCSDPRPTSVESRHDTPISR